jgi:RHS repeat-associated protein
MKGSNSVNRRTQCRRNTVAKQEAAGTTYYEYNTENLMTRIDFAGGGNSYYDYHADSKRVSQRTSDGYRVFVYQGPVMLEVSRQAHSSRLERDESEETVAHYTMGAGLEAMRRETSSFYHYNHLGTALALTGANEAVSDTYRHDAWGVLLERTGSTVNPHTYVGRERYYRMPNAAMYHLGFRDYAQGLGRFTTVDPARWGANWGVNAANRPTVFVDPLGLQDSTPDCCDLLGALERQASNTMVRPNPWNCQWLNELLYRYLRSCGGFNPPLDKDLFPRPYPYPEPPAPPPPDLLKGVESPYTTWCAIAMRIAARAGTDLKVPAVPVTAMAPTMVVEETAASSSRTSDQAVQCEARPKAWQNGARIRTS